MTDTAAATVTDPATRAAMPLAIRVRGLSHVYPPLRRRRGKGGASGGDSGRVALSDVSFDVAPGEVFGILGPNGGGKSTLFRILSTLMRASPAEPGNASVFGRDVLTDPAGVRRQIGVVFQNPSLDGKLTAAENLVHQGRLYGLGGGDLAGRIDEWLARVGLSDRRDEHVESFSGGMRRRLELAKSMLHGPRLLLMDEPTTGLDPAARRDLWAHLPDLRDRLGVTVVLTTHLMEEAERCDRLAFLAEGRLLALDTPTDLKARVGGDVLTVAPRPDGSLTAEELARQITDRFGPWQNGSAPRLVDGQVRCEAGDGAKLLEGVHHAFRGEIRSVTLGQPSLDDVFLHLSGRSLDSEEA